MVNYYYDLSGTLTSDTEGNLVQLCARCAAEHREDVELAQRGDSESECEGDGCAATNDADRTAHLDALMGPRP